MNAPQMRTAARRVRGLGAARSGTKDFWHQRVTSVAGIALCIALIVIAISLLGRSHAAAVQILGSPIVAVIMLLFILGIGEFIMGEGLAREVCGHVSVWAHMNDFSRGIVDSRRLVFDLSVIVLPLFVTVRAVDAWRLE